VADARAPAILIIMNRRLPTLSVAEPCPIGWSSLEGVGRVRYCGICKKDVYDLVSFTSEETDALLRRGEICGRIPRRPAGAPRAALAAAAAIAAAAATACGEPPPAPRTVETVKIEMPAPRPPATVTPAAIGFDPPAAATPVRSKKKPPAPEHPDDFVSGNIKADPGETTNTL
jgi:hypothetical protein